MSLWEVAEPHLLGSNGCLCDIVVEPVSEVDWSYFLSAIQKAEWQIEYQQDGEVVSLPAVWAAVTNAIGSSFLRVAPGLLDCHCHFGLADAIVFDFDPAAFRKQERFVELERFMIWLSRLLGKPVFVTPNNDHEHILFDVNSMAASH